MNERRAARRARPKSAACLARRDGRRHPRSKQAAEERRRAFLGEPRILNRARSARIQLHQHTRQRAPRAGRAPLHMTGRARPARSMTGREKLNARKRFARPRAASLSCLTTCIRPASESLSSKSLLARVHQHTEPASKAISPSHRKTASGPRKLTCTRPADKNRNASKRRA